tara:strand:+ start:7881 stop:8774 length:894 start_codon:yes stop_codon:yes gene_type:complete
MIKHIVLSGGGPNNIIQLGCIKQLYDSGIIKRDDIESIYATSAGAILGLTIALKYDINVVCDYFIKRPWNKVFNFNPKDLLEIIENNGYMDRTFVEEMLDTFITAKDHSKDISLIELYNEYKVRFNIYTIRLDPFDKLVLNHENYPSMPVKTAILMSCALPPMFKPVLYNGSYYIDGGMICNYPIVDCILKYKNMEEIIGLHVCSGTQDKTTFSDEVSMPDYGVMLLGILIKHMQKQNYISDVNEILIKSKYTAININAWKALLDDKDREAMFIQGIELAKEYIIKQNLKIDPECQH